MTARSTAQDALAVLQWWSRINTVLGFEQQEESIPPEIAALLEERKKAREARIGN